MGRGLSPKGRMKAFSALLFLLAVTMILECQLRYPDKIVLFEGESLPIHSGSPYVPHMPVDSGGVLTDGGELVSDHYSRSIQMNESGGYDMTLKLFGLIPVRTVTVDVYPQTELMPCGQTVGIKILTEGLVCVGTQAVKEENGHMRDLAREQDIRSGDIFLKAGSVTLEDTEQMGELIDASEGNAMDFTLLRDGQELTKSLTPIRTAEGYKLGVWLRDSTAGIGTLTFYHPETLNYGALGHPITDADTGMLMPVAEGTLLKAAVFNIRKGEKGEPGELKGIFKTAEAELGSVKRNTECGIYGRLDAPVSGGQAISVASGNQVQEGPAYILSNISEETVEQFEIEIQKTMGYHSDGHKDMVIHVTDSDLLKRTGGIVQGMSGSPIIQNGKIIGAVTHVFVNDPTRGYGIFIENMLGEVDKIE